MAVLCYVLLQSVGPFFDPSPPPPPPRLGGFDFHIYSKPSHNRARPETYGGPSVRSSNYEQEEIPRGEDILTILPHILSTKGLKSPHVSEQGEWCDYSVRTWKSGTPGTHLFYVASGGLLAILAPALPTHLFFTTTPIPTPHCVPGRSLPFSRQTITPPTGLAKML